MARLARLGVPTSDVGFVAADFASDPVAERLVAAGLDPSSPSLFLLEGVAVYLDLVVLERLLRQLRQVAHDGSRLAISVSVKSPDAAARAGFRRAVAAMGEPLRSTIEPDEAGDLLRRTGWEVTSGAASDGDAQAHRDRLRLAGFLVARAVSPPGTGES